MGLEGEFRGGSPSAELWAFWLCFDSTVSLAMLA